MGQSYVSINKNRFIRLATSHPRHVLLKWREARGLHTDVPFQQMPWLDEFCWKKKKNPRTKTDDPKIMIKC